jgi:KDO2-lipid IV(A) lauroyltransferase
MDQASALAIRAVAALPLTLPVGMATGVARAAARAFATSRINRKKFPRATSNLKDAFPDLPKERVRELAIGSYEHLFQLGIEVLYSPRLLTEDGFQRHLDIRALSGAARAMIEGGPCILISGHVGNWELIGYSVSMLGFPMHAVYRPLDLKPLDRWVRETRERQGLTLVSKFGAVRALPPVLAAGQPIGLVADQNGGDRGVFTPFFGRLASTYKSIGILAMQSKAKIICGYARRLTPGEPDPDGGTDRMDPFRTGQASMRYTAEVVDIFGPEEWANHPDPLYYLTARYRRAMEIMVRRSPEQYLWMHRIWRSRPHHERADKPFPAALKEKLRTLPWMTDAQIDQIVDRSDRDRARAHGREPLDGGELTIG